MDKVKKIPIIGYLIRLIVAIVKLPKHVDEIYALGRQEKVIQENVENQERYLYEVRKECQENAENQERYQQKLDQYSDAFLAENEKLKKFEQENQKGLQELQQWNHTLQGEIDNLQSANDFIKNQLNEQKENIREIRELKLDSDFFEFLNLQLSIHSTVWGDSARLHISNLASVESCFFNTNSGDITIGDYTFAGSGVSVLAGSHDMHLGGLLRRELEIKDGCDIVIGNGVWLASESIILGPAEIGDNAIIAAGAVVTPGTIVPPNTIYGGVPAKKIGIIDLADEKDFKNLTIINALKRSDNCLFVQGWKEREQREIENHVYAGHVVQGEYAMMYTCKHLVSCICTIGSESSQEIVSFIDGNENKRIYLGEDKKTTKIEFGNLNQGMHKIEFFCPNNCGDLFIVVL